MECKRKDRTERLTRMTVVATVTRVAKENLCLSEGVLRRVRTGVGLKIEIDRETGREIDRETDRVIDLEIGTEGLYTSF